MTLTRRALLLAAGVTPLAHVALAARDRAAAAARSAVPSLRPSTRGASGHVCARCGRTGHTMLDGRCPEELEAGSARQEAARQAARRAGA